MAKERDRTNPYSAQRPVERQQKRLSRRLAKAGVPFSGERKLDLSDDTDIKIVKAYESNQVADPFKSQYATSFSASGPESVLQPPFNPYTLIRFPNENNILRQCIDAMVINVESMGHRFEYIGPEGGEDSKEAIAELAKLEQLADQPNGMYGLLELRERRRRDLETLGYTFLEICRGTFTREIVSFYHVPAHTVRLTACDAVETEVDIWLMREGKYVKQKVKRLFRRFIQEVGTKKIYFKEYGDPRNISIDDGREYAELSVDKQANELRFDYLYAPGSPYGMPRWINQLPAVMGSRESEMTNLNFFKNNAIPAMAILVSGGTLTSDSIEEIEDHISGIQGQQSIHRIMVLEAEGSEGSAAPDKTIPSPRLEIKPLTGERQNDALFQEYDKNNQAKIRSSFRLPPIFVGRSEDLTYATADASLVMAEGQVFGPERNKVDDLFNLCLLSDKEGKPPRFWAFRSNPPRIANHQTLINALGTLDNLGALTPNIAIGIANELFDLSIPTIDEAWGDYPFSLTKTLLDKGQLKGLEDLREKIDQNTNGLENPDPNLNLDDNANEILQEKIVEPLKKLVGAANVRKMSKPKKRNRAK